jgi:hypothetical protein
MIYHALRPRGTRDFTDPLCILLPQYRAVRLRGRNEIAEKTLFLVREMTAVVLVAEEKTVLTPNLTDLDHPLALGHFQTIEGGTHDPTYIRDVSVIARQSEGPVSNPYAKWRRCVHTELNDCAIGQEEIIRKHQIYVVFHIPPEKTMVLFLVFSADTSKGILGRPHAFD